MLMRIKSFIVGFVLCVLISLSSLYSAMRMGVLMWPTLFVSLLCFVFISSFDRKRVDMKEVTLAHTLASSGSMVAGAIAYTLPGFWIASSQDAVLPLWKVIVVSLAGVLLGTICTSIYKKNLVDDEKLDYPIGKATYLTLNEVNTASSKKLLLFLPALISGVFAFLRDKIHLIPQMIPVGKRFLDRSEILRNTPGVQIWPSMMALSIGALLNVKTVLLLFFSAIISQFVILPSLGLWDPRYLDCVIKQIMDIGSDETAIDFLKRNLAFGLMLGFGIGIFCKSLYVKICSQHSKRVVVLRRPGRFSMIRTSIVILSIIAYTFAAKFSILTSFVLVLAVFFSTYLSARLTGESGINPMEVFAFISFLLISIMRELDISQSFLILISVTVACGLCGDIMNDFKSGVGFGVDYRKQSVSELIGSTIGVIVAILAVWHLKYNNSVEFGAAESGFPVIQASLLGKNIKSGSSPIFIISLLISALLAVLGVNTAIVGLGIYLPFYITLMIALGSFMSLLVPKKWKKDLPLVASGILTGEGVVGMLISFFSFGG